MENTRGPLRLLRLLVIIWLLGSLNLPWSVVSCQGTEVGTQNALELVTGDLSPSEEMRRVGIDASDRRPGGAEEMIDSMVSTIDDGEPVHEWSMLVYFLGLGLACLGILGALAGALGDARSRFLQVAGSGIMLCVLLFLLVANFAVHRHLQGELSAMKEFVSPTDSSEFDVAPEKYAAQFSEELRVWKGVGFVVSFVLTVALLVLGLIPGRKPAPPE